MSAGCNIPTAAFYYCSSLANVSIPSSVTNIGSFAFGSCTNLASLTIPNSISDIASDAFSSCNGLRKIYFAGNAPGSDSSVLIGDTNLTVYYLPATSGWSNTFTYFPTAPWLPQIQTAGGGFGIQNGQFGFNLNWAAGQSVTVQASANLANPVWTPVQSVLLTNGSYYFSEPLQTNGPGRYYLLTSP